MSEHTSWREMHDARWAAMTPDERSAALEMSEQARAELTAELAARRLEREARVTAFIEGAERDVVDDDRYGEGGDTCPEQGFHMHRCEVSGDLSVYDGNTLIGEVCSCNEGARGHWHDYREGE